MEGLTVKSVGDFIIWCGAVSGALVGIAMVLRFVVVKPLKQILNRELKAVHDKTDRILNEVAPDNGVRISERVSRLEIGYLNLDKRIDDHNALHKDL